ncbi:MAG: trypsin-like peptidase domain-containing protein [Stenomitos rutilans HA7619-LM2]|jgi:WD40 repeat protein|nr:trypsin-like peptidase domain-containing protein [Stenomitos rutilans HA7619-LM2]
MYTTQSKQPVLQLQGNIPGFPGTNLPGVSIIGTLISTEPLRVENFIEVVEIVRARSRSEQHALVSVVIDTEDFVPISFLEAGVKQSSSVCRIARYFSHSSFLDFVKNLEVAIEQLGSFPHNFDSADKVIEIFSIPQQIAEGVFSEAVRQQFQAGDKTPLKALQDITENQLAKILPIPIGTGFLVGGSHLLTNHHVIPDAETADQCVAQFSFAENLQGENQKSIDYEFDSTLFVSNPGLDYTLVQLKSGMFTRQAGFELGWIQLVENDESVAPGLVWVEFEGSRDQILSVMEAGKVAIDALKLRGYTIDTEESLIIWHQDANSSEVEIYEQEEIKELGRLMGEDAFNEPGKRVSDRALRRKRGDSVIVVQHPKGRQKQIVLNNNEVITNGLYEDFLRYKADADYGSSGSPAFNTRWELVALHHAAVPKKPEDPTKQSPAGDRTPIECHQGVRTCRIIDDLKRRSFRNPKLKNFIQDFVITAEQLNYPPLPAALEFDGQHSYVSLNSRIFATSVVHSAQQQKGTIKFWSQDFVELGSFESTALNTEICFSPTKTIIAEAMTDSSVKLWNAESGQAMTDFSIKLWNAESGQLIRLLTGHQGTVMSLSLNSDGNRLASGSADKTVKFWNLETGEFKTFEGHTDFVRSVSLSPDSKRIASASGGERAFKLWTVDTLDFRSFEGHTDFVRVVCFSPDGEMIASGSSDKTIKLWRVEDGEVVKALEGHQALVVQVCFSPNSQMLASSDRSVVKLWNLATGESKEIQEAGVDFLSFSSDGQTIATSATLNKDGGIEGGIIKLWKLDGTLFTLLENAGSNFKFNSRSVQSVRNLQSLETLNAITIEAWINPIMGGMVISRTLDAAHPRPGEFTLRVNSIGQALFSVLSVSADASTKYYSSVSTIPALQYEFSHIAATWDGSTIKLYVNGREGQSMDEPSPVDLEGDSNLPSSAPILMGVALKQGTSELAHPPHTRIPDLEQFFSGTIAEVRLWNIARSSQDIAMNMTRQLSNNEPGLVGYWRFEESQSDNVYNSVSQQSDYGILRGVKRLNASQLYFAALPYGLRFSSNTEQVDCANNNDLVIIEAITIEAWIKHKFGNCSLVSQGDLNGCSYSIAWHNGKIRVILQGESALNRTVAVTKDSFPQDLIWHHVAFTWEHASSELSIYIDGRVQDSLVIEGQAKTIVTPAKNQTLGLFTSSLKGVTGNLKIGGQEAELDVPQSQKRFYDVAIADVRLWNVCRPQDQIKANMSRRLNSDVENDNGLIGYWRLDEGSDDRVINLVSKTPATIHGAKWFPMPVVSEQTTTANTNFPES